MVNPWGSNKLQLIHDNAYVGDVHNLEEFVLDAMWLKTSSNNPDPRKLSS